MTALSDTAQVSWPSRAYSRNQDCLTLANEAIHQINEFDGGGERNHMILSTEKKKHQIPFNAQCPSMLKTFSKLKRTSLIGQRDFSKHGW